ncbi:MAG: sigma-70 family RNA polymerase sigma factor [Acidobacteriota bacterium]
MTLPASDPAPTASPSALSAEKERRLLDRLAGGDRVAADRLIEATYGTIFAALVRFSGDRDVAADLTQDTYRRAWQALDSFDRRARFSTWLYRIAYTTFLNHVRRPQPLPALDDDVDQRLIDPASGPDDRLDRREVAARLRRAVLELPEDLRFTVTARFWGELRVTDIAALENVTGAAIRKRLKTARGRLRLALEETSR